MTYSVTVINNSGAAQNVAIFLAGTAGNSGFSLVWTCNMINNQNTCMYQWDETAYGLGWGNTIQPINVGVQFQSVQAIAVSPTTASGNNVLPIAYKNGSFSSGTPYFDGSVAGKLQINTDRSFTVSDALTMGVALYINTTPALAVQGAPNTEYLFDITQFSYYLTVTSSPTGTALPPIQQPLSLKKAYVQPASSMTVPTRIAFAPGATNLKYVLTNTLVFQPS